MRDLLYHTWKNMASTTARVKSICDEYMNGKLERNIPLEFAKDILSSQLELVVLVEALSSWLTSMDIDQRACGTMLLSKVLSFSVIDHTFSSSEVQYLAVFYCDRLVESTNILPYVLQGLLALEKQDMSDYDVVLIIRKIFSEIHTQSLPHDVRRYVFSLFNRFLFNYNKAVHQISGEFLLGYVQSIGGEKDPRNLTIIFDTVILITEYLDMTVMREDLFEVLACYFPINFSPSSTDPDVITKDELVLRLRMALTSTPVFAEFLFPLLLDKLSSDLHDTKIDSLETISAAAPVFGSVGMGPYVQSIWNAIKKEVLQPSVAEVTTDQIIIVDSLGCIRTIASHIADSQTIQDDLITTILKDCIPFISDHDTKLLQSSCRLLGATASSTLLVYNNITKAIIPLLIEQLNTDTMTNRKLIILQAIIDFIDVYSLINDNGAIPKHISQTVYPLLLSYLGNNIPHSLTVLSLTALSKILSLHGLDNDEVGMGCGDILRSAYNNDNIRGYCSRCISIIGQYYPSVVIEYILPSLFTHLNNVNESFFITIQLISSVSTHYDIIIKTIPVLIDLLKPQVANNDIPMAVTDSIKTILKTGGTNPSLLQYSCDNVIPVVLNILITSSINNVAGDSIINCSDVLSNISEMLRNYSLSLDTVKSQQFTQHLIDMYTSQITCSPLLPHTGEDTFQPLKSSSPWQQTRLLCFLTAVLSTVQINCSNVSKLLSLLVQFALNSDHTYSIEQSAKGCGCIANRIDEENMDLIENELERVWNVISDKSVISDDKTSALTVMMWICKGLLLRSHELTLIYSLKILTLFNDDKLNKAVIDGYGYILLGGTQDCLNNDCRANIKLFYKQWYFSKMLPNLLALYDSQISQRSNIITILSHLMQIIPKHVLLTELPKLLPILLASISHTYSMQCPILVSSLTAIQSLIVDAPVIISDHVTSIIPCLLRIAQDSPVMSIRILSLKCINTCTILPIHLLYPHQISVLDTLSVCVNDSKRSVRKEAMITRDTWCMLGSEL